MDHPRIWLERSRGKRKKERKKLTTWSLAQDFKQGVPAHQTEAPTIVVQHPVKAATRESQKIRFPILLPPNNLTQWDASLFTYYSLHFTIFPHNNDDDDDDNNNNNIINNNNNDIDRLYVNR
jgi:hypothetical protein